MESVYFIMSQIPLIWTSNPTAVENILIRCNVVSFNHFSNMKRILQLIQLSLEVYFFCADLQTWKINENIKILLT